MTRPIRATLDLAAIRHNYQQAKACSPESFAFAVIKADAYGHGYEQVAAALAGLADGFALINIEQARALREAGLRQPILLLEGCFDRAELEEAARLQLTVPFHAAHQFDWLERGALPARLEVMLKLNTGKNRLGFRPEEAPRAAAWLQVRNDIRLAGLMTHFATADGAPGIATQLSRFDEVNASLGLPSCVANSAALMRHPASRRQYVRPGIMLYGASPFADRSAAELGLRPAMRLEADIIGVQSLQPGDAVGYGATFVADRPMRIGVVACGYADGYPRVAPAGTPCAIGGQPARLVGRVSMDMLTIDLTGLPQAGVGDRVTLWGGDGVSIDDVATAAGTIGYELMCALAPRVPRRVVGV